MLMPPYLLACAALFWGWQALAWPAGLAIAIALVAPRWAARRIDFQPMQWNRIADLCTALLLLTVAYVWVAGGVQPLVVRAFRWLPLAFLPLALAQAWSSKRRVALSALFVSLRGVPEEERGRIPRIDLGWPYLAVLLTGAAAANTRAPLAFYGGFAILVGWALWHNRSGRFRTRSWLAAFACASALGYAGAIGLSAMQSWLEETLVELLSGLALRADPDRSVSAIGTVGELKRSARIVLRLYAGDDGPVPGLLEQAFYDAYLAGTWVARAAPMETLAPSADGLGWRLADSDQPARALRIVNDVDQGIGVLPLPPGAFHIARLAAEGVKRNRLGTVQAHVRAARADYSVRYAAAATRLPPPSAQDLAVPAQERAALETAYAEAGLDGLPPAEQMARLAAWFAQGFRYATYRAERPGQGASALSEFLRETRAGHCEYFASAAVLLLRRAGIPARYATGFALHEWSDLEGAHVARLRDAHAWALAWRDGAWHAFDATPPNWLELESVSMTPWRRIADLGSWAGYRLARLREGESGAGWVLGLGGLLALWLAWRIGLRRRDARTPPSAARTAQSGLDSPWFTVEAKLAKLGHARSRDETPRAFAVRLQGTDARLARGLAELVALHYRYRFDPRLDAPARTALRTTLQQQTERWLRSAGRATHAAGVQ